MHGYPYISVTSRMYKQVMAQMFLVFMNFALKFVVETYCSFYKKARLIRNPHPRTLSVIELWFLDCMRAFRVNEV